MLDFKARMHKIPFPLGLCPMPSDPAEGADTAPPNSAAVFKGPTSKGRGAEGRRGKGRGRKDKVEG